MFLIFIFVFITRVVDAGVTTILPVPVLYEDQFVKLTTKNLILKWYFFPCGNQKTIPLENIESFFREPVSMLSAKGWGMALSNVWYACDPQRQFVSDQSHFLSVGVKGGAVRKGFSVENFAKFEKALAGAKSRDDSTLTIDNRE